jgi:WD40 repeat protein
MINREMEQDRAKAAASSRSSPASDDHITEEELVGAPTGATRKYRSASGVQFAAKKPPSSASTVVREGEYSPYTPPSTPTKPPASGAAGGSKNRHHHGESGSNAAYKRPRVDEHLSSQLFAALPESKIIFSCGHWDHSFKATLADTGRLAQSVLAHSEVVTCLALASDFGQHWLITGSKDCTVMVWEVVIDRMFPISWTPLQVLYGHDNTVTCLAVNAAMDMVASGSDDGTVILSTLRDGQYLRTLAVNSVPLTWTSQFSGTSPITSVSRGKAVFNPSYCSLKNMNYDNYVADPLMVPLPLSIRMLCLSVESNVLVYTSDDSSTNAAHSLYSFTVNGRLLERIHLSERLMCMVLSEDGKVLVTGGERCLVLMRWVHNLQLACDGQRTGQEAVLDGKEGDQPPFMTPIRSLYFTLKERHLIVGLESGEMRILAQVNCYHTVQCSVLFSIPSMIYNLTDSSLIRLLIRLLCFSLRAGF